MRLTAFALRTPRDSRLLITTKPLLSRPFSISTGPRRGLAWTMLSPAPMIAPGQRTGVYRVGSDSPIGDAISAEDFAVAIVDELEKPAHTGNRFTVAN